MHGLYSFCWLILKVQNITATSSVVEATSWFLASLKKLKLEGAPLCQIIGGSVVELKSCTLVYWYWEENDQRVLGEIISRLPFNQMAAALNPKHDDTIPMFPPHWVFNREPDSPQYTGSFKQRAVVALHHTLCIINFRETSLCPIWEQKHAPELGLGNMEEIC